MSGEAIEKIRNAEEKAVDIKNSAAGEASDAVAAAKKAAADRQAETEEKAHKIMNQRIESARQKTDEYIKDEENKAIRESGQVVKNARHNIPDAVKRIVVGVIGKWQ